MLIFFVFCKNVASRVMSPSEINEASLVEQNDEGISHASVAKMISLLEYKKEDLITFERTITYRDTTKKDWYDMYINGLQSLGFEECIQTSNTCFGPNDNTTYEQLNQMITLMEQDVNKPIGDSSGLMLKQKEGEVKKSDFFKLYEYLRTNIYFNEEDEQKKPFVEKKELSIIEIKNSKQEETKWQGVTDFGTYTFEGIDLSPYVNKQVEVYQNGKEIVAILGITGTDITIRNAWIVSNKGTEVTIFIHGIKKTYELMDAVEDDITQTIADLIFKDNQVVQINLKPDKINDKVLVFTEDYIELEKYGKVSVDKGFQIYKIVGEVMEEAENAILVGYKNTDFVVSNGKICAALIKENLQAKNIRVLIHNNGYKDIYHKEVKVTSGVPFIVTYGQQKKEFQAGEELVLTAKSELLKGGRVEITPKTNGKIKLSSLTRSKGIPEYRGMIEIAKTDRGVTVINELPLEEYLYGVIGSEMPTSYGLEALKVQAVCARSYAYNHLLENSCSRYGAHVDDSTSYQVYNNQGEDLLAKQAVDETKGQVLEYDGKVIFAYYFSTSCGHTSDINNVWMTSKKVPYLVGKFQGKEENDTDYSKEKAFEAFIRDKTLDTYDKDYPWYRWTTSMSYKDITKVVNSTIGRLYNKNKKYVKTLDKKGTYISKKITTVGTVTGIKVAKRETSGLVTELIITGTKATVKICTESFIRQILRPKYDSIVRNDESEINQLSLLPSSFFFITKQKDGVLLTGGGYGHGVGMSQNGVKTLVGLGKSYTDILKHYYHGIEIGTIY